MHRAKPLDVVADRAVWRGAELDEDSSWIRELTEPQATQLLDVATRLVSVDPDLADLSARDVPLPDLAALLRWTDEELQHGRGAVLLRGVPIEGQSDAVAAAMFVALGAHLGSPMHQNARGDLLCHVFDTGRTYDDPTTRAYQVPDRLPFHSDASDIVGLLCLKRARVGGLSRIVSTAALYNEVVRRAPQLAPLLFEPWHFDRRGEEHGDELPFYSSPICSIVDGVFSMTFGPGIIRSAQRHDSAPRLTEDQINLLTLMDEIVEEPGMSHDMDMEPGDVQLLLNYSVIHSRTGYEDWDEPERKRHLLRLWLKQASDRRVAPHFGRHYVVPHSVPTTLLSELVPIRS